MVLNKAYDLFYEFVITELNGKPSTGNWINIRGDSFCFECSKHKRSSLYVLVKKGSPIIMNCFRAQCGMVKRMKMDDFIKIGFKNMEAISLLSSANERDTVSTYKRLNDNILVNDLVPSVEQAEYFYRRCRMYLTEENILKFRMIPDIHSTMKDAKVLDEKPSIKDMLNHKKFKGKHLITFANKKYNVFICRSTSDEENNKVKLLFTLNDEKEYGYTLQNGSDIETLIISEGIFDIINIYTKYAIIDNALYVATLGFAHTFKTIQYYFRKNITTLKRLIIFMDSDIKKSNSKFTYDKKVFNDLINKLDLNLGKDAFKEIYLVYNKSSKDFGDVSEDITPEKIKIRGV